MHSRDRQPPTLFRRFDGDGGQAFAIQPLRVGVLRPDRHQGRCAQFGGFLGDQIERAAFDRREDQPQIRVGVLGPQLLMHHKSGFALANLVEFGAPLSVGPIEQADRIAASSP